MPVLRDYQRDIVERIINNYDEYDYFFINSPTGSGKTAVMLHIIRRLLDSNPRLLAIWFTRTHSEYKPIIRDNRKFGLDIRIVPLYGKKKTCRSDLRIIADETGDINPCKYCMLKTYTPSIQVVKCIYETGHIGKCLDSIPRQYCIYNTLWDALKYSNLGLATYPYIIGYPRRKIDMYNPELFIVDEAHNIDHLNNYVSATLSLNTLDILEKNGVPTKHIREYHTDSYDASKKIIYISKEELIKILENIDPKLYRLYNMVLQHPMMLNKKLVKAVTQYIRFLNMARSTYMEAFVTRTGFKLLITNIYRLIQDSFRVKTIFMSGTMPPYDYIEKIWGLRGLYIDVSREYRIIIGRRQWYWARDVTTKLVLRLKYLGKMRKYIERILLRADRVVLVVFPSYEYMSNFLDIAYKHGCIVETGETDIEAVEDKVIEKHTPCIFAVAGGKLVEGIEITSGNTSLIKTIVLAGVPYPNPDDYQARKAYHIINRLGLDEKQRFLYIVHYPALISTKQAIGRGIRSPHDENKVFLLDWRFKHFLRELGVDEYIEVIIRDNNKPTLLDGGEARGEDA